MSPHPVFALCLALLCAAGLPPGFPGAALQASAQAVPGHGATPARLTAADIEAAEYHDGDLPRGQSAITARIQILLDRSGISPGVVDGWRGGMSESAIRAFQRRAGLSENGQMSPVVWQLLQPFAAEPLTMEYTITEEDGYGLVDNIPADYGEKARMTSQGYTSIAEKLAERFHMDERFLRDLNPDSGFQPGDRIVATVPAKPIRGKVSRIIIDKQTRRVAAYDARGRMLADYPATVGSDQTPSPHGTHTVTTVALDPVYTYNPHRNFQQGENDRVLTIPPGPNGPVGNVWIDLSEPTYGIHGTATPSRLFVSQSNGCVRLTNWDARELAHMVQPGVTVVEFLATGTTIADVTARAPAGSSPVADAATTVARAIHAARPLARPQSIILASATSAAAASITATDAPGPEEIAPLPVASPDAGYDALSQALAEAVSHEAPAGASGASSTAQPHMGLAATPPPRRRAALPGPAAAALPASHVAPAPSLEPVTAITLPAPAGQPGGPERSGPSMFGPTLPGPLDTDS